MGQAASDQNKEKGKKENEILCRENAAKAAESRKGECHHNEKAAFGRLKLFGRICPPREGGRNFQIGIIGKDGVTDKKAKRGTMGRSPGRQRHRCPPQSFEN